VSPSQPAKEEPPKHPAPPAEAPGVFASGPRRGAATLRQVVLPPGYDAKAARSTLRRYPKQVVAAMRSIAGTPTGGVPQAPQLAGSQGPWQEDRWRESVAEMEAAPLAAVWLGHATVLLRIDGQWVLTDPVHSEQIGVRLGLGNAGLTIGPKRLLPALPLGWLPPLDLIILSHAHFDHLDRPTLAKLASKRTSVLTAAGTAKLVPRGFASVREVPWQTETIHYGLSVRALRPAHWGARTMWDRHRGFASYVLRGSASSVLYAGDTAITEAYANLSPARTGAEALNLSIFGIGAYDPWIAAHANPEQVWAMHMASGAQHLLPMHHSTFVLSDEPLHEPMERLLRAAGEGAPRIVGRSLGEAWVQRARTR